MRSERATDAQVGDHHFTQPQLVLVVLELPADPAHAGCEGESSRPPPAGAEGGAVPRHLREPVAHDARRERRPPHHGVVVEVVGREGELRRRRPASGQLPSPHADALEVEPLPAHAARGDEPEKRIRARSARQRHVADGIAQLARECGRAQHEQRAAGLARRGVGAYQGPFGSGLSARDLLGAERGVGLGDIRADAERAVEFVERRSAESLLRTGPQPPRRRRRPQQADARAEARAVAVGVAVVARGHAGRAVGFAAVPVGLTPAVVTRAQRGAKLTRERTFMQHEGAADRLASARHPQPRERTVREREMLARLAAHGPGVGAEAGAPAAGMRPRAGPGGAERGRRHGELIARRRLAGARGVHAAEGRSERLILRIRHRVPRKRIGGRARERERGEFFPRRVALVGRAVAAFLLEVARGRQQFDPRGQGLLPARRQPAVPAPGGNVDRPTTFRRDEPEAVGREIPREHLQRAHAGRSHEGEFTAARPVVAERGAEPQRGGTWTRGASWRGFAGVLIRTDGGGKKVYDAAERGVAPGGRAAAGNDLRVADALARQLRPRHPAAKGIVERHAVEQDERTARAGWSEAAQRDALRGGVRRETVAAAKQAEARDAPQRAVERRRGRLPQGVGREQFQRGRDLLRRQRRARCADHERVQLADTGRGGPRVRRLSQRGAGGHEREEKREPPAEARGAVGGRRVHRWARWAATWAGVTAGVPGAKFRRR